MQIILFSSFFSLQSDIQTIAKIGKMSSGEEGWHTDDTPVNHQMLKWFVLLPSSIKLKSRPLQVK